MYRSIHFQIILRVSKNISLYDVFYAEKIIFIIQLLKQMNRIKEVLAEKGIKQTWLADNLGKSYNMVNAYVGNRRQPSIDLLNQIA